MFPIKRKAAAVICCFVIMYLLITSCFIYKAAHDHPPEEADYLIVLGAKVNGSEMSLSLYYRAETALRYLQENPETKVIVTGGQGREEQITEAEAVKRYLLDNGIPGSRILIEDQSTSTLENLLFAKEWIADLEADIVVVSNDFHLFRAGIIAKRLGLSHVYTLAAPTPDVVKLQSYLREYAAILKSYIFDWP